jgi:hypothetical protein
MNKCLVMPAMVCCAVLRCVLCCTLQSLEAAAVTYARMQDYSKSASYLDKLVSTHHA